MEKKVAVITGGSSGIGLSAVRALSEDGYETVSFSRREGVDVGDEAAVIRAVEKVISEHGQIDLLVNAAGFGISGAIEFTETEDAIRLMDTDFFGTVRVCRAVIPHMRSRRCGKIINISSVAAPAAIPFQAFYSSAKAAVDAYTAALANELKAFGITVCAIRPGDVKTGFTKAREKKHVGNDIYGGRIDASVAKMERDETGGADPDFLGRYIRKTARKKRPKPFYTPGLFYKLCVILIRHLPCGLVNALIGKLYIVEPKK